MRLTQKLIAKLGPGRHSDSQCRTLQLLVTATGGRSWVQRLTVNGRRLDRGLGGAEYVNLAEAREIAARNRFAARRGGQPFAERREAAPTFEQAARRTLEANRSTWAAATVRTWIRPLQNHVFPKVGARRVNQISRQDVIAVLAPIWTAKPGESSKILARMRTVFEWVLAHDHVQENPCANGIKAALPSQERTRTHHDAVPYRAVPDALNAILASGAAVSAKACARFVVLTACRSAEARGATWDEIDFDAREWRIRAARMKSRREHRVPLSDAAMAVLRERQGLHPRLVFGSERTGRELSHAGLFRVVRDACGATTHGFRTSLRTWAAEQTSFPHAVCEMALAHQVGSAVERSYARSDLFEKRRGLMDAWAEYVAP